MADFSALKTSIQNYIKQNGNEEITGNLLQQILLSMVSTLGDSAINDLVTALNAEIANRGNADTELGGRITTLQGVVNGIVANVKNGYVYAGIAIPSITPVSGKVFYLALTAGTYTNFGAIVVPQGINILKYNGSAWSLDAFIGLDEAPTQNSSKLVKSGGVLDSIIKDGAAFDLSAYNGGTTYADLSAALTALNALPAVYKKGGMSVKYVQTQNNKYVQFRLTAKDWSTNVSDWQGIATEDDFIEPTESKRKEIASVGTIADVHGYYINTPEWLKAVAERQGRILEGIKKVCNGLLKLFYIPVKFLSDVFIQGDLTVKGVSFDDKITKEEGKSLVDDRYFEEKETPEYVYAITSNSGIVGCGLKKSGAFYAGKFEGPTIKSIKKKLSRLQQVRPLKIGAIVWEGQPTIIDDYPQQIDMPSTESSDYSNYILFNNPDFRQALRVVDGDTYDSYTNWKAYIQDKYDEKVSNDASLCEVAAYHSDIKDIVENAIINISNYSSADISYLQNRNLRKPLNKITLAMLGDDATLDHDVTLGGWGCDGYRTVTYTGETEHIGSEDYQIVDSVTFHDTEKVTAQIDLASKYGIDFFCFYIEFVGWYFDERHSLEYIHKLMQSNTMNNFLYQFLNSPNKNKMKFCVMIGNTLNRWDDDTDNPQNAVTIPKLNRLLEYIYKYLVPDSSYLHINGRPVIQFYEQKPSIMNDNSLHIGNSVLLYQDTFEHIPHKDGIFCYNMHQPINNMTINNYVTRDYEDLSRSNITFIQGYKNFPFIMFPAAMSRDDRPRYNYIVNSTLGFSVRNSYIIPTEDEFYNQLKELYDISNKMNLKENIITIYAWNEFMEGGWLLPTQQEIENGTYLRKLNAIKKFKNI